MEHLLYGLRAVDDLVFSVYASVVATKRYTHL